MGQLIMSFEFISLNQYEIQNNTFTLIANSQCFLLIFIFKIDFCHVRKVNVEFTVSSKMVFLAG